VADCFGFWRTESHRQPVRDQHAEYNCHCQSKVVALIRGQTYCR
jgi:hypothetical protein